MRTKKNHFDLSLAHDQIPIQISLFDIDDSEIVLPTHLALFFIFYVFKKHFKIEKYNEIEINKKELQKILPSCIIT